MVEKSALLHRILSVGVVSVGLVIDPVVEFLAGDEDGWVGSEVVLERVLPAGPGVEALRLLTVRDPGRLGEFERVQYLQAVAAVEQQALVAVAGAVSLCGAAVSGGR